MEDEHNIMEHPYNLKATGEDRIEHLTLAILILREHIQKFGREIKTANPGAFIFITNKITEMERELKIRRDYVVPKVEMPKMST